MDGISFISEIRLGMEFLQSEGGGCNTPPAVVILRKELMEQIFVEFLLCVRHIPKHWGCGINRKCKAPDLTELTFGRSVSMFGVYGTHLTNTANL